MRGCIQGIRRCLDAARLLRPGPLPLLELLGEPTGEVGDAHAGSRGASGNAFENSSSPSTSRYNAQRTCNSS